MAIELKSNSFGTLIANVIPGFFLLYTLSYYVPSLSNAFSKFLELESSIGLFFLMTFFAIGLGLLLGALRSYIFEGLIYRKEDSKDNKANDQDTDLVPVIIALGLGIFLSFLRLLGLFEKKDEDKNQTNTEESINEDKSGELNESKVVFLRMVVDEQYRYHQFYGSILLVEPFYFYTIAGDIVSLKHVWILSILVISLTGYATHGTYQRMLAYLNKLKY